MMFLSLANISFAYSLASASVENVLACLTSPGDRGDDFGF
jgi:hypothetical protein